MARRQTLHEAWRKAAGLGAAGSQSGAVYPGCQPGGFRWFPLPERATLCRGGPRPPAPLTRFQGNPSEPDCACAPRPIALPGCWVSYPPSCYLTRGGRPSAPLGASFREPRCLSPALEAGCPRS